MIFQSSHVSVRNLLRYTRPRDEYTEGESFTGRIGFEVMPRRATAVMAVLAVIIHCVLGCCARCLNAGEHHHHDASCQVNCLCCEHHHHAAGTELCLQPAGSWQVEPASSEADSQPEHQCPGCGKAKCAFILKEPISKRLTGDLVLPGEASWVSQAYQPIDIEPQALSTEFFRRKLSYQTPKVRLHLCLAVLTL